MIVDVILHQIVEEIITVILVFLRIYKEQCRLPLAAGIVLPGTVKNELSVATAMPGTLLKQSQFPGFCRFVIEQGHFF